DASAGESFFLLPGRSDDGGRLGTPAIRWPLLRRWLGRRWSPRAARSVLVHHDGGRFRGGCRLPGRVRPALSETEGAAGLLHLDLPDLARDDLLARLAMRAFVVFERGLGFLASRGQLGRRGDGAPGRLRLRRGARIWFASERS